MVPEEIHKPAPEHPSQCRVAGFPLLHDAVVDRIDQQVHLKIRLHAAGLVVTQEDLVDDNRLGHYVLELREIAVGEPPADRTMRIRD